MQSIYVPKGGVPRSELDFRRIFQEYGRYVWRVLRRMGVPSADVPDLAQEVFVILQRKLHHVHSPASLRSFIYGIAVREASDDRRSARVRHETLADILPIQRAPPGKRRKSIAVPPGSKNSDPLKAV